MKALKEGRTPVPGPPGGMPSDGDAAASGLAGMSLSSGSGGLAPSDMAPSASSPVGPSAPVPGPSSTAQAPPSGPKLPLAPPPMSSTPMASSAMASAAAARSAPEPVGNFLDSATSEQVQKYCRYTISALQYDDVNTAIMNLEKALATLKPHQK